jgi:hypothetical protein
MLCPRIQRLTFINKQGRIFIYRQTTEIDKGKYKFIVPYPTTHMRGNNYNYDIKPISSYTIQINDQTMQVFVPENAVILGKQINVAWKHSG